MAQTIPPFPLSVIDNLVSDISKLIDEHQLGDETLDNAPMFKGAWTIGVRSNRIVHPIALQSSLSFSQLLGNV